MSDRSDLGFLADWLRHLELRAEVFARPDLCAAWRINTGLSQRCTFHALVHGRAWLHRRQRPPQLIEAGELVFVPPGHWHCLTPEGAAPGEHSVVPDGAPEAALVCGWISAADAALAPLIAALPQVLVLGSGDDTVELRGLASLLKALCGDQHADSEVLLTLLAELVLLLVARHALSESTGAGLLAALRDPRLGAVLARVQRDPAQPWTLESMAALAHMSRTAFAVHFHCTVGETPAAFVRRWRMRRARRLIDEGRLSVAQVAQACGYRSESSFRRAFSREQEISAAARPHIADDTSNALHA